jgi:hypothetical protein
VYENKRAGARGDNLAAGSDHHRHKEKTAMAEQESTTGERESHEDAGRRAFEVVYAESLKVRCRQSSPSDRTDDEEAELGKRESELVMQIATTPAVLDWQVFQKFSVTEDSIIEAIEGGQPRDYRQIHLLAGLKADLMRLGIGKQPS